MNRRTFVGRSVLAVMSAGATAPLLARGGRAAAAPLSAGGLLAGLEQLAVAHFGAGGLGNLSWFTPTGPNPPHAPADVLGSAAFHGEALVLIEDALVELPVTDPIYDELIALFETPGHAAARARDLFGAGPVASAFTGAFAQTGMSNLKASLGALVKLDAAGLGGPVVATAVHMLGALGFDVFEAKDLVDEVLGDTCDVQIVGSIAAAATLSAVNLGGGNVKITSSDGGPSTGAKKKRGRWGIGKILGFLGAVILGSLIGGLLTGGTFGGIAAGGALGGALFVAASGGGFQRCFPPPRSPCETFPYGC